MTTKEQSTPKHFRSTESLAAYVASENLGTIDAREWKEEWHDGWVVYADLIAFAARTLRSQSVVVNNIIRFDRASHLVAAEFSGVDVRRFSDATFGVCKDFHTALAFSVALAHVALAFNLEYLARGTKPFFIHLIAPRITIARGEILQVPNLPPEEPRFAGIDPKNVLAGSAIVAAYGLEKHSAGGLITIDAAGQENLAKLKLRGSHRRVKNGLRRWLESLSHKTVPKRGDGFFVRGSVADVPWLLLRPLQNDPGNLWAADPADSDRAISAYLLTWDKSVREFYSIQNASVPLDVSKHPQAAIRHAIQCYQLAHGRAKPSYKQYEDLI